MEGTGGRDLGLIKGRVVVAIWTMVGRGRDVGAGEWVWVDEVRE